MQAVLDLDFFKGLLDAGMRQASTMQDDEVSVKFRRRLAAAKDRLELGLYGTCCACKEPIAQAVLVKDVSSPFCGDCQEDFDFRRVGR
ncbi:hypothetical protein [Ramlibacter sp. WS9]|uniref:hypothetical protein n=1 Tax=Ramlibacter sp. WS9 TaxID=1882741 RepID=UPI001144945E|nr:hypothetical protein [Ramlibacter sp. WS9]ROZ78370.1 hypothetical protein EEB15_08025 [Ramlibacter sp. WS9]